MKPNQHSITLNHQTIYYTLNKSSRAKHIRLSINQNSVKLTLPDFVPHYLGKQFLKSKSGWLLKHLNASPKNLLPQIKPAQLSFYKIKTRNLVRTRLNFFNSHYRFKYSRITIRNQKTRWGSCSSHKTLSFNLRLCLLPTDLSDYIIVHELCHLKELNHSQRFWALVAQTIPNYKARRKSLRRYSLNLG